MNILITGGTGFLGSHIVKKLLDNNNAIVISRGIKKEYLSAQEMNKINFIQCDLRNPEYLKTILSSKIDLVIHAAGIINIRTDGRYSNDLIEMNLISTINLIETMVEKGIKHIIFCSSMTVYGIDNYVPAKEDSILKPIHFYGLSKKWAEEVIISYAYKGLINALILRYPGLYGHSRKAGYIYNIAKKLFKNEDITIDTNGLKFWETINVEAAAEITKKILKVWRWDNNYEIINCSYGEETDFINTAFKIKEIINSKSSIEVKKPLDYVRFYLDNSKLKKLIDFNYSFDEGLKNFLHKYKDWLKE